MIQYETLSSYLILLRISAISPTLSPILLVGISSISPTTGTVLLNVGQVRKIPTEPPSGRNIFFQFHSWIDHGMNRDFLLFDNRVRILVR